MTGIPPGERCNVVVVARDGTPRDRRHLAGRPAGGWRDGITLDGSALIPLAEVAAVVVENEAGQEFAIAQT